MKFLPSLSPLALASLTLALSACATPANRRELYNTPQAESGPWHDYERRREAEATTGVSGGSAPTVVPGTRGRPTTTPASAPLPPGTSPAPVTPAAPAAVPAQVTDTSNTGAPPVPINPPAAVPEATSPVPAPAATPDPAATPASP